MVKPNEPGEQATDRPMTDRPIAERPLESSTATPHYEAYGRTYEERRVGVGRVHHQAAVSRISWGALFAGLVSAIVLQILFTTLGMAVGLSTLAADSGIDRGLGIGAGIWWVVTGLISLFGAGWIAGRVAGIPDREDAMIHGFVTWCLATLFGTFVLTSTVGTLVGGTLGMLNQQLANNPRFRQTVQQNVQQVLPNQAQQPGVVDEGEVFPPAQQGQRFQTQPGQTTQQQAQQATERAAEVSAPAMWLTFIALLLGAAACIGGAILGTPETTTAVAIGS